MSTKKKYLSELSISVVMPSKNSVTFLESAIRSVLEQDYSNVSLIIADGMSNDGTLELIQELQKEFSYRLTYFSFSDNGPAQAINKAINLSDKDIVGWLNSDDMYSEGAIKRAADFFSNNPDKLMVYGHGNHVDLSGVYINKYPTKRPSTSIDEFSNGSFICQPTVFIRKEAFSKIGLLDESLQTSFDYEFFIRFFKRYQKQIGFIDRVQAYSRIHNSCITFKFRKKIALEAMQIIHKHLGDVPEHWFFTHLDEIFSDYPFSSDESSLKYKIESFLKDASSFYKQEKIEPIISRLKEDSRFRLANDGIYATVHPDGWVSNRVFIKYKWVDKPANAILVKCNAAWPIKNKLRLKTFGASGEIQKINIDTPNEFILRFEIPQINGSGQLMWTIEANNFFIPMKFRNKSNDSRKLAFIVSELKAEF